MRSDRRSFFDLETDIIELLSLVIASYRTFVPRLIENGTNVVDFITSLPSSQIVSLGVEAGSESREFPKNHSIE
jgi:hypothetical protein